MQIRKGGRDGWREGGRISWQYTGHGLRCQDRTAGQEPGVGHISFPAAPSSVPGTQSWPICWEEEEKKMTEQIQFILSLQGFGNNSKFALLV